METIGQKISEIRKRKGLSQESLSDLAKINLRTLQRIEKGETEPLGNTLKNLCNVLEINIEDILDYGKVQDNKFLLLFYISVMSFLIIPLGNLLVPMILWMTKRDKIIDLNKKGIFVLKFQLVWTVFFYGSIVSFALVVINHLNHRYTPLLITIGFIIINVIFVTVMSIQTIKNKL
jgi:transcriptional regulator with XRE-family HTH domain